MATCVMANYNFLVLCLIIGASTGSVIQFSGSPTQVKDGLTPSLILRCSLNDTASSASVVGKRDVTRTSDNVDEVTSVIVMRGGKEVAIVTHKHPATVLGGSANLQAVGDTTGSAGNGEQGFLELTIDHPTSQDGNEYVCEVNAVNALGHNVVFSTSMEVDVSPPTIADLVGAVQRLDKENKDLKSTVTGMSSEIQSLKSEVGKARHIEHGRLNCDWEAGDWNGHEGHVIFDSQSANFSSTYENPPIVFLSIIVDDHLHSDDVFYYVTLKSVSKTGFTMHCNNWNKDRRVWNLWVDWISFAA